MISNISIRPANSKDCEYIVDCVTKLSQIVLNTKLLPRTIGIEKTYHEMLNEPGTHMFVAEKNGKKVGAAVTTIQNMLHMGGKFLYIQELIVDDKERGSGIGSKMLKYIEDFSKENGCFALQLTQPRSSSQFHKERTEFYTKNGYEDEGQARIKIFKDWFKMEENKK